MRLGGIVNRNANEDHVFLMAVRTGCICPNGGRPDENGNSYYCPSCQVSGHGLRSPHIVYHDAFGGYWEVVEQPPRAKHRARLPVNTESLRADARLTEAVRKCRQKLAAREDVSVSHRNTNADTVKLQPSTERSITVEDTKAVEQQTAAGYAKSNAPIPQSSHNPFPATGTADGISTIDQPFDQTEVNRLRGTDPNLLDGDQPKQ